MSCLQFLERLLNGGEVEWTPLGDVAELKRGTSITKNKVVHGDIPVIAGGPCLLPTITTKATEPGKP